MNSVANESTAGADASVEALKLYHMKLLSNTLISSLIALLGRSTITRDKALFCQSTN